MQRKILAIVEGEKADFKLMNHLLNIFLKDEFYVWPYCTNLYNLYTAFKLYDADNYQSIDTLLVIKSIEKDPNIIAKLNEKYTDIILIFDMDPQDARFSTDKIQKMKAFFNESTDNGKLYINYPMVESFKHLKAEIDEDYINRMVKLDDLKNGLYKTIVHNESYIKDYEQFNENQCLKVVKQNLQKSNYILNAKYEIPNDTSEFEKIDFNKILGLQCKSLADSNSFFVLCTSIIYLLDYQPTYFIKRLQEV